ncbi:MAG: hypothetical protein Q8Q04_03320 [archaeon]|nr:hypothetical protein [archaeon]
MDSSKEDLERKVSILGGELSQLKQEKVEDQAKYNNSLEKMKEYYNKKLSEIKSNADRTIEYPIFFEKIKEFNFLENLAKIRYIKDEEGNSKVSKEDMAKVVSNALAIAFHTSDFAKYHSSSPGWAEVFSPNYKLLKNDLSFSKANLNPKRFIEHDMECSTRASNVIYKICKYLGIGQVGFLIDDFNINPDLSKGK